MWKATILDFERDLVRKLSVGFVISICLLSYGVLITKSKIIINVNRGLSESQKELFEKDLREKTGLQSIGFNQENELDYDVWEVAKSGSQKMREAITGAIDDELNIFQISNYSNAKNVHFAIADKGMIDVNTKITYYELKFDFADFESAKKYSDAEALNSFTLAMNLFHEINHKVSYTQNNMSRLQGVRPEVNVRQNVNSIRQELGLIMRDTHKILGKKYRENMYKILFVDKSGKRKFLRWKVKDK